MNMDDIHPPTQKHMGRPGEYRLSNVWKQQKATMSVFSETTAEGLSHHMHTGEVKLEGRNNLNSLCKNLNANTSFRDDTTVTCHKVGHPIWEPLWKPLHLPCTSTAYTAEQFGAKA